MSIILAGKGDGHFSGCVCQNGTYFALIHNVNGLPEEVGEVEVKDSQISAGKEVVLVRSENADLRFTRCELSSDIGVILRTEENDDPARTLPSENPFGIEAAFEEMRLEGDILHEDAARELRVTLT